jgi:hypothetical protein
MPFLMRLIGWEIAFLLFGLAGIVVTRLLTGDINTNGLFRGVKGDGTQYFSPERVQLLLFTLGAAFQYLVSVLNEPSRFPAVSTSWLVALGGSHVVYLGGKLGASLVGRRGI